MLNTIVRGSLALLLLGSAALGAGPQGSEQNPSLSADAPVRVVDRPGGFANVLPADTLAFFGLDDTRVFAREFAASCMGKLWVDAAMAPLRAECDVEINRLREELMGRLGVDVLQLPGLLDGAVALAVLEAPTPDADPDDDDSTFVACLLADFGMNWEQSEAILAQLTERLREESAEDVVLSTEVVDAVDVTSLLWPEDSSPGRPDLELRYGFHEGLLIAVFSVGDPASDPFERVLSGLDESGSASLAQTVGWRNSSAEAPDASLRVWADVGEFARRVVEAIVAESDSNWDEAETDEAQPQVEDILSSLGLNDMGVLSAYTAMDERGSLAEMHFEWRGAGWIPRLLQLLFSTGELKTPSWVPADCRAFSAWRMEPAQLYDQVLRMLFEFKLVDPGEYAVGVGAMEEELGFSPREDLLETLSGEFAVLTADVSATEAIPDFGMGLAAGGPINFALLIGLQDGQTLARLVDDFIRSKGLHNGRKSAEFQGHTMHNLVIFPPFSVNYAILDDVAVLSLSATMVQDVLRRRSTPDLPSLAADPEFLASRQRLGNVAGVVSWSDTAAEMRGLLTMVRRLPEFFGGLGEVPEIVHRLSMLPLPAPELMDKYFPGGTLSIVTVDETGLRLRSVGP
ncbi:MAG: hypothetical protein ACT4PU_00170 [Planctomycetota bacterium]